MIVLFILFLLVLYNLSSLSFVFLLRLTIIFLFVLVTFINQVFLVPTTVTVHGTLEHVICMKNLMVVILGAGGTCPHAQDPTKQCTPGVEVKKMTKERSTIARQLYYLTSAVCESYINKTA